MPKTLEEEIDESNPVRVIDLFVETLDLEYLGFTYANSESCKTKPSYDPRDMLKLYVYSYFNGIRTSRKIEKECCRNKEIELLINYLKPDDKTIANFRKDNKEAIIKVFTTFTIYCNKLRLIENDTVAIDGTKIRASNSRKRNYTQGKVEKMLSHFDAEGKKYIALLEQTDACDEKQLSDNLTKINLRKEELTLLLEQIKIDGEVSLTDPDSRHMSAPNNGTDIAYNVQTAVDNKHHIIVATDVVTTPQDNGQLSVMAAKVQHEFRKKKITVIADKGYYNSGCLEQCQKNKIKAIVSKQKVSSPTGNADYSKDKFTYNVKKDIYVCPQGKELSTTAKAETKRKIYQCNDCATCKHQKDCAKAESRSIIIHTNEQKIYDKADKIFAENSDKYKTRQCIVEHPFGTIKRTLGYNYFLTRGKDSVAMENSLHCLAYNITRVIHILGVKNLVKYFRA